VFALGLYWHCRISHTPAQAIEPGYSLMSDSGKKAILAEVASIISSIGATHGKVEGCFRVFRSVQLRPDHDCVAQGAWKSKLLIKDCIADIALQQVLTRPEDFDVIATLNLNGDYLRLGLRVWGRGLRF